ncbi:Nucleotide-binding universal stress protein, UspA family [Aliiroseovarius sediminilitoris]|uniref:Nucleotide-binding universal stress protein, UspA family n=1 Tax=Aliiroseovarius sediminilitoris TaxID=1173584 RepID=A0A1I0QX14_9RHOB|nr:universal stress protein [Aliiroseovarius sediminilitoris]SEW32048.1 Nucleotide-binding universal stress protein, UspA family [Aliiroseovarius sediminilitoris]
MYKKILVPMALDHGISPETLEIARNLLAEGGDITALHVHEAPQASVSAYLNDDIVKAGRDHAHSMLMKKTEGLEGVTPVLLTGHTARTIIDYAHEHDFDCVVIGSHKPGLSDFFLGSTAARVVRHCRCAVHVQRTRD